jgi:L-ornithine Nalpha-acyltransferase
LRFERHIGGGQQLKIRLAQNPEEVTVAQRLRYEVFARELGAVVPGEELDADSYDGSCDHLLVIAPDAAGQNENLKVADGQVVGTYRLLPQAAAKRLGGFYSQTEFDVDSLVKRHPHLNFLELGRSCVLAEHRGTSVVELLWQGIWNYVRAHRFDVMLGCASFEGTDPSCHGEALSFLAQVPKAQDWRVDAQPGRGTAMNILASHQINVKRAISGLPPLIKGYLRLGCHFGEACVVDPQFKTTDVLVVLPVSAINPRYFARFGAPGA